MMNTATQEAATIAPPALTEYRYANSILWGPTYDEASGMHIITAASDAEAFEKANRCDKLQAGFGFLQRRDEFGQWQFLDVLASQPHDAFAYIRPDEVAECWDGIIAKVGLYEALWGFVGDYNGPSPEEAEEPIYGQNSLAGFWDRLSLEHRLHLNDIAAKQPSFGEAAWA